MTAPAGLLSPISGPTAAPPHIESDECSESSSYLYDGENSLWWRFTAPEDGIYGFDTALCSVSGTTDADEPYALLSASVSPVWIEVVAGTSCEWAAYELTSGQTIDISITALSSIDDFINDTLRPVDVSLRSSGPASVETIVDDPPTMADLEFVGSATAGGSGSMDFPVGAAVGDVALVVAYSKDMSDGPTMSFDWGLGGFPVVGGNIISDVLITQTASDVITLGSVPSGPISIDYADGSGDATLWVFRFTGHNVAVGASGSQGRDGKVQSNSLGDFAFGNDAFIESPPGTHYTSQNWTFVFPDITPEDTSSVFWESAISVGGFVSIEVDSFVPGDGLPTSNLGFTPGGWTELSGSSSSMQGFVFEGSPFFKRELPTLTPYATASHLLVVIPPAEEYEYTPGDCEDEPIFVIRQYPRDDMFGFSGSPRVFPPVKGKLPEGSKPRFIGGFD